MVYHLTCCIHCICSIYRMQWAAWYTDATSDPVRVTSRATGRVMVTTCMTSEMTAGAWKKVRAPVSELY
jgi:hypothetical protein